MRDRAKKLCMKLLAAVMVISMMIPVTASAQDEEAGVSAQASDALTLGLNWTSGEKEVVTGKTYPYQITVTNNTSEAIEDAELSTWFASFSSFDWDEEITMDGSAQNKMVLDIPAGETVTIDVTVTFPSEAAIKNEDGLWSTWGWMRAQLCVGGEYYNINTFGDKPNHSFTVVAPEEDTEPQEPVISVSGLPDMLYAGV